MPRGVGLIWGVTHPRVLLLAGDATATEDLVVLHHTQWLLPHLLHWKGLSGNKIRDNCSSYSKLCQDLVNSTRLFFIPIHIHIFLSGQFVMYKIDMYMYSNKKNCMSDKCTCIKYYLTLIFREFFIISMNLCNELVQFTAVIHICLITYWSIIFL